MQVVAEELLNTSLIPVLAVTFFFLDLAIYSTLAYVDEYLLISLALFFLADNFGGRKSPDHGVQRKWPLAQCVLGIRPK
jgi:hypothetical protein